MILVSFLLNLGEGGWFFFYPYFVPTERSCQGENIGIKFVLKITRGSAELSRQGQDMGRKQVLCTS